MSSADLLRRAAAVLRENAEAATSGPWTREWAFDTHFVVPGSAATVADGNVSRLKRHQRADAEYIALVHPPVALALAELLEHIADDISDEGGRPVKGVMVEHDGLGMPRFDWTAAVALARAVLREEAS